MEKICLFPDGEKVYADIGESCFCLKLEDERVVSLFGDIRYNIKSDGCITIINSNNTG